MKIQIPAPILRAAQEISGGDWPYILVQYNRLEAIDGHNFLQARVNIATDPSFAVYVKPLGAVPGNPNKEDTAFIDTEKEQITFFKNKKIIPCHVAEYTLPEGQEKWPDVEPLETWLDAETTPEQPISNIKLELQKIVALEKTLGPCRLEFTGEGSPVRVRFDFNRQISALTMPVI